jgi:hypothetical protein
VKYARLVVKTAKVKAVSLMKCMMVLMFQAHI